MSVIEIILAIFLPPVVVAMRRGAGMDLLVNILLWIFLFGIGGVIHAFYICTRK